MKTLTLIITMCLIAGHSFAEDTTINFRKVKYSEVFDLAKKEQKNVFLYFHFDGCSVCKKMENTAFLDKNVAEYFNENFVCFEVNTREGEGIETNKIYNVHLHPTFIYLDKNANALHSAMGGFSPENFIQQAKDAFDPTKNLSRFSEQYKNGNRDADFLFEYCYKLRDVDLLDPLIINEYLKTQSRDDLKKEKNIKFIYEFAILQYSIAIPFESIAFQFLLEEKDLFTNYFESDQLDTRIVMITDGTVDQAINEENHELFNKAINILKDFDNGKAYLYKNMEGVLMAVLDKKNLVFHANMAYYKKLGDDEKHRLTLNEHIASIWDDSEALNSMAWDNYLNFDDAESLTSAKSWVERSIDLNPNYANTDTYASILYKLELFEEALTQAEKAILIAKDKGLNYNETSELINKIKKK
ncbi:MAG: thioredoxin-related protein [Lentimonas sp.]|jgi:thioredoxin-related protein